MLTWDLLAHDLARRSPRFIYTMPTFQNPTGVVMSPERRRRLLLLSNRYQVPILEDDPYGELRYAGVPVAPLVSLPQSGGRVLSISTLSKTVAPAATGLASG